MLTLLLLAACRDVDDIPGTPWDVPILVSDEDDPWHKCAPERDARVACVVDGDTFDISACGDGERFRMLGVDTPETEKPGQEAQCWADNARTALATALQGQTVTLAFDRTCVDVYGRTLAYVWLDVRSALNVIDPRVLDELLEGARVINDTEQILVNEYMLLAGHARRFDEDWVEPLAWEPELIAAERLAQVRGYGLWGACEP